MSDVRFTTVLGCEIRVQDAPEHLDPRRTAYVAPSLLMSLSVPGTSQYAEVVLSPEDRLALRFALEGLTINPAPPPELEHFDSMAEVREREWPEGSIAAESLDGVDVTKPPA